MTTGRLASVVSLTAILDVDRFAKFATGFDQLVTEKLICSWF